MTSTNRDDHRKLVLLVLLVAVVITFVWKFGDELTLTKLAAREAAFRQLQAESPGLVSAGAVLTYVTITGLSLPGAAAMSLVVAWLFGFWKALVLVSFSSTAGATIAFLLSRYLFRDAMRQRFGDRLQTFNESLKTEGAFYLFTLRLIPAVPFFAVNAVMGLTPISAGTFWWVSQLGMLPGTAVFVYAGSRVPSLQMLADNGINAIFTPQQMTQVLVAFTLLGLFPLVVRNILKRFARTA